jgi:MinD-like ATPase involved in chromosome partitioning or flagellar assembly
MASPAGVDELEPDLSELPVPAGRLLAVWGAAGAPGRTSTAIALAAEAADRGHATLLVDADPYGGAVAQHLAVLDEASGLLGAARLANAGQLDPGRLMALARSLDPGLRVLTGLPRPGRWPEVRPIAFEEVLAVARLLDELVVVDTGPGLEPGSDDPFDATPNRDETTRTVLAGADAVVVVAAPDPVGLQRAARALTDLVELRPAGADIVAVNRMRPTLGWQRRDVVGLLQRVAPLARITFLPDDPQAADRALVAGRTLVASGDSGLRRAAAELATEVLAVLGLPEAPPARRARRRLGRIR